MKKPTGGADQAPNNLETDPTVTPPPGEPPVEPPVAPPAGPITHPSEGGTYVRDPETGHLTKQED